MPCMIPFMCLMVLDKGVFNLFFILIYMDELSNRLNECKTGELLINHLMYADDLRIFSPYCTGLQQMLKICSEYGVKFNVKFNYKKSCNELSKLKMSFSQFYLGGEVLNVCIVAIAARYMKYLGHLDTDDLIDDKDIAIQCGKLYAQGNMLVRKFHICTPEVKVKGKHMYIIHEIAEWHDPLRR